MAVVAELEIRHSRSVAPTRRVALGDLWLPTDPPPGPGGLLLAGITAMKSQSLDDELRDELDLLLELLERGRRVSQPRLRHRFQTDVVGLDRSRHRLVAVGRALEVELDDHAHDLPQVLGAVYAAALIPSRVRAVVFRSLWRALRWDIPTTDGLFDYLRGDEAFTLRRHHRGADWALDILGFHGGPLPARQDVLRRFRHLVRIAHPDHGAEAEGAGTRVTELTEAKRILLASS